MNAVRLDTSAHHYYAAGSNKSRLLWLLLLATILVLASGLSIGLGTRAVSLAEILNALNGHRETMGEAAVALRIPRTLLAIIAGAALGLAGCVMQGITRNPLADPGILGVNMGAALAMVIAIAWFNIGSTYAPIWVAIGGAGAAATFVYIVGSLGRGGRHPAQTRFGWRCNLCCLFFSRGGNHSAAGRSGRQHPRLADRRRGRRHFRSDRPCIAVSGVWAGDQSIECPKTEFTRIGRGTCSGTGRKRRFRTSLCSDRSNLLMRRDHGYLRSNRLCRSRRAASVSFANWCRSSLVATLFGNHWRRPACYLRHNRTGHCAADGD